MLHIRSPVRYTTYLQFIHIKILPQAGAPSSNDILILYLLSMPQLYTAKHLHLPVAVDLFHKHGIADTVI